MIKPYREKIFPDVRDWQNPQNKLRYSKIKNLTFGEWIWFNPTALKIFTVGIPLYMSIFFFTFSLLFYSRNIIWLFVIFLLMGILQTYKTTKSIKELRFLGNKNLYDQHIRDIPVDEQIGGFDDGVNRCEDTKIS